MPLGDDFDGAVGHFYGGLIVNRVRRHWYIGGSSFCVGQGILRESLVIQVHKLRKINQPQPISSPVGRLRPPWVSPPKLGVTTVLPALTPT